MVVARQRGPVDSVGTHLFFRKSVRPEWFPNYPGVLDRTRDHGAGVSEPAGLPAPPPPAPPMPAAPGGLVPDLTRVIWHERNVDVPSVFNTEAAYDLSFHPEIGQSTRGVLVVTSILNFQFDDGVSKITPGATLTWTPQEKKLFMAGMKALCESVWSGKHRLLTTASPIQPITDAGVIFRIQAEEGMFFLEHSHWNVHVEKTDQRIISSVLACGGGVFTNGVAHLDSLDLQPSAPPGLMQRAAVHEFGHTLGYRDEYAGATVEPNTFWVTDTPSIMNTGETVRPRHYAFFADWLSRQTARSGSASSRSLWKVNGTFDLSNAHV
jgi:hypothetical protein